MREDPKPIREPAGADDLPDPGFLSGVLYGASLPERLVRGMIGAASGVLKECAEAIVPDAMKGSKLYEMAVRKMLRRLIVDVGGLKAPAPPAGGEATQVVKVAVSNAVDIAGIMTLHLSPLWLLAILSDVAFGARTYLHALVKELKSSGVIAKTTTIESVDDLLGTLQRMSGTMTDKLDAPPLTLLELKRSVEQLREESANVDLARLIPADELDRLWRDIHDTAAREGCTVFEVSSAMGMMMLERIAQVGQGAFGSIRVGFDLLRDNVLEYYAASLARIRQKGYYTALAETYEPYLRSLRLLFEPSTPSITEEALTGRLWRRFWQWLRRKFRRRE
jgi:hypothetical protein